MWGMLVTLKLCMRRAPLFHLHLGWGFLPYVDFPINFWSGETSAAHKAIKLCVLTDRMDGMGASGDVALSLSTVWTARAN